MEDPRNSRWAGWCRASQVLDGRAHRSLAHSTDEHLAHQIVDLTHSALIALEELSMETSPCAWNGQIFDYTSRGAKRARTVASTLIAPLARPLIAPCTNELGHLLFQDVDKGGANRLSYLLVDKRAKGCLRCLTVKLRLRILGGGGHGYPPYLGVWLPQV